MSDGDLRQLGDTLRMAREERGLTVRAVAELAGISASTVTRLEIGKLANPRANQLAPLFRVLGVDIEELYAYAGFSPAETLPELPVYLRTKHNMTPDQIARFQRLLHQVEGENTPTSPEGTRDGEPSP